MQICLALWALIAALSFGSDCLAAAASASLAKVKQEAEAKGYVFLSTHEEIIAHAKH